MDISGILVFIFAGFVSVLAILTNTKLGKRQNLLLAFVVSLSVAVLVLRPWEALYPSEWVVGVLFILILAAWAAVGTLAGGAIAGRFKRRGE